MRSKKNDPKKPDPRQLTHDDVPAPVGLVKEVREELRSEIRAVEHGLRSELKAVENNLRSELKTVEKTLGGRMDNMDRRFDGMDQRLEGMQGEIHQVLAAVHGTQVLMEEQRGENKIVLDGLKLVMDRMDRFEAHVSPAT